MWLSLKIVITDVFLGGNFVGYGVNFSYSSKRGQVAVQDIIFPKMSKQVALNYCKVGRFHLSKFAFSHARCHLYTYGPSGTLQLMDGLCVLPLNILHEHIYIVLWYWYLFLLFVTTLNFLYWLT